MREQTEPRNTRDQTENRSSRVLTGTRLNPGARERACVQTENWRSRAHANHTETGSSGARERLWEPGAAGGVRSTKDRDVLALEVRAGTPGVGAHIPGHCRVFSSTHSNRVKVAKRAQ